MYVKTTKGIYELTELDSILSGEVCLYGKFEEIEKPTLFRRFKNFVSHNKKDLGEVVAQSDNLNDLIEIQYHTNDKGWVCNLISNVGITGQDRKLLIADTNDRIVGLIRIGNDLVKVADWDNEKGEWKLYER